MFTVLVLLLLGFSNAFAGGPADKATGTVGGPPRGWRADFNAHEEVDGRPAKGTMRMWSDEVNRELELLIVDVTVEGNEAWFTANCISDSWVGHPHYRVGHLLYVHVEDGGSPGTNDYIGWLWDNPIITNRWQVTDGNLVVHTP